MNTATESATTCTKCGQGFEPGRSRRANGNHVICRPVRTVLAPLVRVAARPSIPQIYACGCADQRVVERACTCALITSCAAHGTRCHGTHS